MSKTEIKTIRDLIKVCDGLQVVPVKRLRAEMIRIINDWNNREIKTQTILDQLLFGKYDGHNICRFITFFFGLELRAFKKIPRNITEIVEIDEFIKELEERYYEQNRRKAKRK